MPISLKKMIANLTNPIVFFLDVLFSGVWRACYKDCTIIIIVMLNQDWILVEIVGEVENNLGEVSCLDMQIYQGR